MEENVILSPEEVTTLRKKREASPQVDMTRNKFENHAGMVKLNYESKGRFSIPETVYFKDFTTEHINNFTLSSMEDLTEQIAIALDDMKNPESNANIGEMTLEEFLETLVAVKLNFNTKNHVHRWVCDCQKEEKDQKVNETTIDLTTLQYKSIEEVDESLKKDYKAYFNTLSEEQFTEYKVMKYGEDKVWTKEDELASFEFKEPIYFKAPSNDVYGFRLIRLKDIINAGKLAKKKWAGKINQIERKQNPHGMPLAEAKFQKEQEIETLKKQEAKDALLFAKALTLVEMNGKPITTFEEQVNIYKNFPREAFFEFNDFLEKIDFGIVDKREYSCPICGKTEERLLQQDSSPIALLPIESSDTRASRKHATANIYFGFQR